VILFISIEKMWFLWWLFAIVMVLRWFHTSCANPECAHAEGKGFAVPLAGEDEEAAYRFSGPVPSPGASRVFFRDGTAF
jgi:hypothetical protein